ncbi:histidine kinase dimerization/phosphoacceptor domain -containing protein [Azospirillum sp. SYSU D00513]|uniref:sensor histidine kinase n=1 Tax=Azospirillum sp. SYSU D00513 TaxID=2812561 RepID=UPI001A968248|nr:histidine kinase dimerization/phosphoacceptor domain -containing protein [Azospirillum sp. SYSU D00513]
MTADSLGACDDPIRIAALHRYEILDTPREQAFDELTELVSRVCRAPMAVINFIETRRQWFKAEVGLGVREMPLDLSICRHLLLQPGLTVIPDLRDDPRMRDNPLVSGEPNLRFYAGYLLQTAEGQALGTLCVLDHQPRDLDQDQRFALKALAGQVMGQMELRLALKQKSTMLERQDLLVKEVNHRVKNNLQIISSIISLQMHSIEDAQARAALMDTSYRIRSIAALHERLYRADSVSEIDLAVFLQGLVAELQRSAPEGIALSLEAVPVTANMDVAVAVCMIVNELVTNALKYAYDDGVAGSVRILLRRSAPGRVEVTVRDHGRGLPEDFDLRKSRSLGMKIVLSMASQLHADLSIRNASPGAEATVTLHVQPS